MKSAKQITTHRLNIKDFDIYDVQISSPLPTYSLTKIIDSKNGETVSISVLYPAKFILTKKDQTEFEFNGEIGVTL